MVRAGNKGFKAVARAGSKGCKAVTRAVTRLHDADNYVFIEYNFNQLV